MEKVKVTGKFYGKDIEVKLDIVENNSVTSEYLTKEKKSENIAKKIFNFNLCPESVNALEELSFHYGSGNLSYAIEKILKKFCAIEDEQREFERWIENFDLPNTGIKVNRSYYLEIGLHDCLNEIKKKYHIREKAKMMRLLIFFYCKKEGLNEEE